MRIAVTGARGFTGRYVMEAIETAGAHAIDLAVDLTDGQAIDQAVRVSAFDCLIHLAAKAFVADDAWEGFYHVNQIGTFSLLEAVAKHRPGTRCILASSAQIYGPGLEGLISEDVPANPSNHYALSKYAMELGSRQWGNQLQIHVARPFNYTGVGQDSVYLIPKIVDHFRQRSGYIELGNTWVERDFSDVRSVAAAYAQMALVADLPTIVNICSGNLYNIDMIIEELKNISGHDIEVRTNSALVRRSDVHKLGGDVGRLRSALPHWNPLPLMETLEWMYRS